MALDLTQYERTYANKKEFAIDIATNLIECVNKKSCCKDCSVIVKKEDIDLPAEHLETIINIVDAIMYSSGYWASHTITKRKNGNVNVIHKISIMSFEEKQKEHTV